MYCLQYLLLKDIFVAAEELSKIGKERYEKAKVWIMILLLA